MAVGTGRKLLLLLWKNALIIVRQSKFLTFIQLGLPSFFALMLFMLRMTIEPEPYDEARQWPQFTVDEEPDKVFQLAYAPNNSVVRRLMVDVVNRMGFNDTGRCYTCMERTCVRPRALLAPSCNYSLIHQRSWYSVVIVDLTGLDPIMTLSLQGFIDVKPYSIKQCYDTPLSVPHE